MAEKGEGGPPERGQAVPWLACSEVRALAHAPKGGRFSSRSGARTWVAGLIPALVGVRAGGDQWMCLSHVAVPLPLPLSPSFTLQSSENNTRG